MSSNETRLFLFAGSIILALGVAEWAVAGVPVAPLSRPYLVLLAIAVYPAARDKAIAVVSLAYAHGCSIVTLCQDSSPDSVLSRSDASVDFLIGSAFIGVVAYVLFGYLLARRLVSVNRRAASRMRLAVPQDGAAPRDGDDDINQGGSSTS